MSHVPKAVLYYFPKSIWSTTVRIALEEKGYGEDEVDLKIVDLNEGENYEPTYLRLNPKATVPALVVPYEDSLTEVTESRYKALTDSKAIIEFLDKSRSLHSHTHTTSGAPAPTLSPATIAGANISKAIVNDIIRAEIGSPGILRTTNARDDASLKTLADNLLPSFRARKAVLDRLLGGDLRVSEKTRALWKQKLSEIEPLIAVYEQAGKSTDELDDEAREARAAFFKRAKQAWEVNLPKALQDLSKEMIGPYTLGDQFSLADVDLAAWITRIAALCGARIEDDGATVVNKIETYVGLHLPRDFVGNKYDQGKQSVLSAFWDAVKERGSWKKVYGGGLF